MKTLWLGPAVILLVDCTIRWWVQESKSNFNSRRESFDGGNVIATKHGCWSCGEPFAVAMEIHECTKVKGRHLEKY